MDGWDGWSDGPITPASNNWTELPCVSTTTIDEAIIKEAVSVGRVCLNDDNNSKKMKAAVLTPIGIPRPSSTELILLSFNKSLGILPLSIPTIIGDSSPRESSGWDSPDESETLSRLNIQDSMTPNKDQSHWPITVITALKCILRLESDEVMLKIADNYECAKCAHFLCAL